MVDLRILKKSNPETKILGLDFDFQGKHLRLTNIIKSGPDPKWIVALPASQFQYSNSSPLLVNEGDTNDETTEGYVKSYELRQRFKLSEEELKKLIVLGMYEKFEWFVEVLTLVDG